MPSTLVMLCAVYEDSAEKQLETEGRDYGVIAGLADWERLLSNTNSDFNNGKNAYEIFLI